MKSKPPFPLTIPCGPGSVPVTRATLVSILGEPAVKAGEERGRLETVGPWSIPLRYTAHAVEAEWSTGTSAHKTSVTFLGKRTAYAPKESGYVLECRVSVGGRKRSGFTSSVMFEVLDPLPGETCFVEIAVIHLRK